MNCKQEFLALHRYYLWANRFRTLYDGLFPLPPDWTENPTPEHSLYGDLGMYMSHWYAALYVVVEGWQELELKDKKIDKLLESDNVDLLRRFRNTIYHYQNDYYDERYTAFLDDGFERVPWIRQLNQEFGGYFLKLF